MWKNNIRFKFLNLKKRKEEERKKKKRKTPQN